MLTKLNLAGRLQRLITHLSYLCHRPFAGRKRISWVVGTSELANVLDAVAGVIPDAYSVSLTEHPFIKHSYNYQLRRRPGTLVDRLKMVLVPPWLLGKLVTQARGFVYVGESRFNYADSYDRAFEFRFLQKRGCKLVCLFGGTDIRSIRKLQEFERQTGIPSYATYIVETDPRFNTDAWDRQKQQIARAADRYADLIISVKNDQMGYLERDFEPFPYFYEDDRVVEDLSKFDQPERLVVAHAPSSPVIKGTPLVRAAVAKLQAEGYDFEYVELVRLPHDEVMATLKRTHILLNQFYSFMPGVLGVEGMANGCAVLMSASPELEPDLPAAPADAWLVTPHYLVYDHLKLLLDNPELARQYGTRGIAYVRANMVASVTGPRFRAQLEAVLRGDVSAPGA